jgi:protein-disulfide isomerase
MITAQLAVAPASFTVTAEEDLSIPNAQDDPLAGGVGDEDSATLAASAAGAEPANERRPREVPVDAALPRPTAAVRSADEVPVLRPAPHAAASAQPGDDRSAAAVQAAAAPPRTLPLLGGKVKLRVDEQLLLGPPAAEMLLVTLFDYTCPHCRAMHFQLRAARAHYGDRLGLILIPIPLNSGCNSAIDATSPQHDYACHYARLALVVWKHNREAFPQFHDWLFEPLDAPPPGVARRRAAELVSNQPLNEAILDPWVDNRLRDCVALYRSYGGGQIPKIVMAGSVITGDVERRTDLFRLIDTAFSGLTRSSAGTLARGRVAVCLPLCPR